MNASVDVQGILDHVGANPEAAPGSQAWTLAMVAGAVAELVAAANALTDNMASITKAGIRIPLSTREAAAKLHAAVVHVRGAK